MSDLPLEQSNKPVTKPVKETQVKVTHENADLLTVHYLNQVFNRLGYIIKLLEKQQEGK